MAQRSTFTQALRKAFMRAHIGLYRASGGLLGSRIPTRSFLLLTTIGRKSGQERVIPIFYVPRGDDFILIGSNWGQETPPLWWLNLQAHPQAKVRAGRREFTVTARQASPDEHAKLWPAITASYHEFARYQRHLAREIPLVILSSVK